jgi:nucleotide-binding universal stress UspA family protein
MTEFIPPARVFLATDLSARCDRALERAAQLARQWHSQLVVLHVVSPAESSRHDRLAGNSPSWRRPEPWAQTLERLLRADLESEGIAATSRVVIGSTTDAVQQASVDERAGLVVLGISKDADMDRIQLGSTADALVRHADVPVLNVRRRARAAYGHVVIATDFSRPSLHALRLAVRWFEGARLTLFHAVTAPGSAPNAFIAKDDSWCTAAESECAAHIAEAALTKEIPAGLRCIIERGLPETLLTDYITSADVDLVMLGSQGRSGLARVLLGSTAENLLHSLDCDTLVVRSK